MTNIENCPVHPTQFDLDEHGNSGCEGCTNEIAARTAEIEQLQAECQQRVAGLAREGIGFPHQALDALKVDIMWGAMFQGRMAYEAETELGKRALDMIKAMQSDANKARLMQPAQQGGLHVVKNGKGKR
jgi:hypothetical protein